MDTYTKYLEGRHTELFAALAKLNSGLKHGTIKSLDEVQEIVSPIFPEPHRNLAPQNASTLLSTGRDTANHMEYQGRRIITNFDHPPISSRSSDWSAIFDDYDGAEDSNCPVGRGATEKEAVGDLIEKMEAA